MQVESALFFETVEQIYLRIFRSLKPRTPLPEVRIRFRKYANANSRVQLADGQLSVDITDLLQEAPAPVQEALASILLHKLFRRTPEEDALARYRRYLNRTDIRHALQTIKQQRGRKILLSPIGTIFDLEAIFEKLNLQYFHGLMARPQLGWSVRPSRTILGHYDPSHHVIVLSNLLDNARVPELLVQYVMFHEMLHLRFPTEHTGARRCVHTREFKKAEKTFHGYKEAQLALRKLAGEFRDRALNG